MCPQVPPKGIPLSGCSPPVLPGPTPATEVLTAGKHLKTEWLPGRRKKRQGWNGMGWGMATGRAQKILKLGDYQAWLVPEGSWAPPSGGYEGADVTWVSAGGGSISPAFSSTPRALLRVQI